MQTTRRAFRWGVAVAGLMVLAPDLSVANPSPPCDGHDYGIDISDINDAMQNGAASDVRAVIKRGKEARGDTVGCFGSGPSTNRIVIQYEHPDFTVPTIERLVSAWNSKHKTAIAGFSQTGPLPLARDWGFQALGGYYGRLAGLDVSHDQLRRIATVLEGSQYSDSHAPWPPRKTSGMWGAPATTTTLCDERPKLCATFDGGPYAGKKFTIADMDPPWVSGVAGYDQGIFGVMMVEAALAETDQARRKFFRLSAKLAGHWAIEEHPVHNHNYTAKLIWLLAELYNWTGDTAYRDGMLDKLERNLKPGVLMDQDHDGKVDGMDNQPFSGLARVAQNPGRMWDAHNSRPEYNGMNAFAMVAAYTALRDRGDSSEAAKLKPYALAMLDNISWEVINLGVPNKGKTQYPFALALGLHRIAAYENQPHPDWEKAFVATWNAGAGDTSYQTAIYLLYRKQIGYVPLSHRALTSGFTLDEDEENDGSQELVAGCNTGASPTTGWAFGIASLALIGLHRARRQRRFAS